MYIIAKATFDGARAAQFARSLCGAKAAAHSDKFALEWVLLRFTAPEWAPDGDPRAAILRERPAPALLLL
jgi:hypothetical protein